MNLKDGITRFRFNELCHVNKYDYLLKIEENCMKDALIIIDVQNDYFPGGTCELHKPYEAEERIKELIEESRAVGRKIVYTHVQLWISK